MWLHWHWSLGIAAGLGGLGLALRRTTPRPATRALVTELWFMFSLYTLWRVAGRLSVMGVEDALDRGRDIWRIQQALHLPSEQAMQAGLLSAGWLMQAANIYYATAHATGMGIFLVWLYFRHRAAYPRIRTTLVLSTFACLVVSLVPVAPPRLLPELGFVDVARSYGQSVYAATLGPNSFNQLSAMPSVHVGWAVLVGWFGWRLGRGSGRWLGPAHAVLTVLVVTVTANHWLLDGVVAVALLVAADRISTRLDRRRLVIADLGSDRGQIRGERHGVDDDVSVGVRHL
jgi:hypothetical protein